MSREKGEIESVLEQLRDRRRTPVSTYRLQLHRGFGFQAAEALLPYLSRLGITDCYTSPILKARPGSTHGYDVTDPKVLNPELGTETEYESFAQALKSLRMGHILDFVPNHIGVDPAANPWWNDVLENGISSPYAKFFDIHWNPVKPQLKGKVLLPVLGDQYGVVLEQGDLKLAYDTGMFSIRVYDQRFPIDPKQYPRILRQGLDRLKANLHEDHPELIEFLSILTEFENLPANTETQPERVAQRRREKNIAQDRLTRLAASSPAVQQHLRQAVAVFNGEPGHPESFDWLHALLEAQAYRLASWKTASHEINYRRFFDINALAGLRVEYPEAFASMHQLTMRLVAEGKITGLRIDHPDGLYDPAGYFEAVQDLFLQEWVKRQVPGLDLKNPEAWHETIRAWRVAERKRDPQGLAARPLYIVAEKILSPGEVLDPHWAIDGETGYSFLNDVIALFVKSTHAERMRELYARFSERRIVSDSVVYSGKKLIVSTSMASELNVLAYALDEMTERDRRSRDFTLDSLREALREVISCFPVYRTYINSSRASARDLSLIDRAIEEAQRRNPAMETSIFDFIRWVLNPKNVDQVSSDDYRRQLGFTMKLQQYTGPVHAKGLEDTAFYRYNVLLPLNEVGSDPTRFGITSAEFHEANQKRRAGWPYTMLATSTHDTKRGEDARARLAVLSDIPDTWETQVQRWADINQRHRTPLDKEWAPDRNDEYHFYQALLGAWGGEQTGAPLEKLRRRMRDYMHKAIKEAKLHTSWVAPNEAYEKGVEHFVEQVLEDDSSNEFLSEFIPFAQRVAEWGMLNSLSQLVLKIASPGVPDFYQGSELWDLNLVDPDNRREVDYATRQRLLDQLEPLIEASPVLADVERRKALQKVIPGGAEADLESSPSESKDWFAKGVQRLLQHWHDGRIKMFMTACGLHLRRRFPEVFREGDYLPLEIRGEGAQHVIAFARHFRGQVVIAIGSRHLAGWNPFVAGYSFDRNPWGTTTLQWPSDLGGFTCRSLFTGESVFIPPQAHSLRVGDLLSHSPVELLYGRREP